jgi:hypothetical protein
MMVLSLSIRLWADILQLVALLFLGAKLCSLLSVPLLGADILLDCSMWIVVLGSVPGYLD